MLEYFVQWGHHYVMHFGAIVSVGLMASLYKDGLPEPKKLPKLLLSAVCLAAVVALFSSHSHTHYIQFLSGGKGG